MLAQNDIYEYIINFVDEEDIMNMLSVNQTFYNEKILLRVMQKRFPVLSTFRKEETWRDFYIKMLFSIIELKKLGIPYIAHPEFNPYEILSSSKFRYSTWLSYCVECGDKVNMNLFLKKTKNYHRALKSSVKIGDLELISFFIEKGADVNYAFSEAVKNGKFVDFFLIQGANHFDSGLLGAIKGRNIDLVNKMIDKGAKNFREALELALKTNQKNIIDLLLSNITNFENYELSWCLKAAAEGGNLEMVEFMLSKGADNYEDGIKKALIEKLNIDIKIQKSFMNKYFQKCLDNDLPHYTETWIEQNWERLYVEDENSPPIHRLWNQYLESFLKNIIWDHGTKSCRIEICIEFTSMLDFLTLEQISMLIMLEEDTYDIEDYHLG